MPEAAQPASPRPSQEAEVVAALGTRSVVLVGMMATGKTSVARQLGRRLHRRVYDSDAMIVARTGRTVAELFDAGFSCRSTRSPALIPDGKA